jgi:hypothetical protein
MRGIIVRMLAVAGGALVLTGCAFADSHASLPAFMRAKAMEPAPPGPPPDVGRLVSQHLDAVFVATSNPHQVRVSAPLHEPGGPGWTACVRADVTSATGKRLSGQTYRITINDGMIVDRRRAEADDSCASESYQPIPPRA